ncbi:hypothetical protein YC2023_059089 [Brassica napus]
MHLTYKLRYVAKTDMVEMVLLETTSGLDVERYHHISSKRQRFDSADADVCSLFLNPPKHPARKVKLSKVDTCPKIVKLTVSFIPQ